MWTKKYPPDNDTFENDIDTGEKEHTDDYNAALGVLRKSNEEKSGRFLNKLKFWQTSNAAKLSSSAEKLNVRIYEIIL